jgi:hypothetical protein
MAIVIPTLSATETDSWIEGPLARGRRLFTNYMLSDRWQSHSYDGATFSIVDILLEVENSDAEMARLVRDNLTTLYQLHFDRVNVSASVDVEAKELSIGITWYHNDIPYSIAMADTPFDTILANVSNEHNTGDPLYESRYQLFSV